MNVGNIVGITLELPFKGSFWVVWIRFFKRNFNSNFHVILTELLSICDYVNQVSCRTGGRWDYRSWKTAPFESMPDPDTGFFGLFPQHWYHFNGACLPAGSFSFEPLPTPSVQLAHRRTLPLGYWIHFLSGDFHFSDSSHKSVNRFNFRFGLSGQVGLNFHCYF